jgi:hypothetical protein
LQILARHLQRRFRLLNIRGPCAALARAESRSRIDSEPSAVNSCTRFKSAWIFRFCARAFCSAASFLAIVASALLRCCRLLRSAASFIARVRLGLMHPLFIDAIVYLEQHLARLDNAKSLTLTAVI